MYYAFSDASHYYTMYYVARYYSFNDSLHNSTDYTSYHDALCYSTDLHNDTVYDSLSLLQRNVTMIPAEEFVAIKSFSHQRNVIWDLHLTEHHSLAVPRIVKRCLFAEIEFLRLECDRGDLNGAYNTGFSKYCKLCGYCGDGIRQDGEECDLGYLINGTPGANCSIDCKNTTVCPSVCGNGIVEPGEECEPNGKPDDQCGKDCKWKMCACGNGVSEYPEQCDDGDLNGTPTSKCTKDCKCKDDCGHPDPPRCGDGIKQPAEPAMAPQTASATQPATSRKLAPSSPITTIKLAPAQPVTLIPSSTNAPLPPLIGTPSGKDYCACRAGYRANGLTPTDRKRLRLNFYGQGYRAFVAPAWIAISFVRIRIRGQIVSRKCLFKLVAEVVLID
ncbi:hypothetical protein B0J14DRAFT_563970 [Halenospora varia]|nr:hypothetical protein B0J14DRAFT_563970 [Halenospora varia]